MWFDGLGAALVSSFAAALTALLVVRLTSHHDRRLQMEAEARAQAVKVMTLGKEVSTITTTIAPTYRWTHRDLHRRRDQALIDFQVAAFALEAMLVPVDLALAVQLQLISKQGADVDPAWVRSVVDVVSAVYGVRLTSSTSTADE